MANIQGYEQFVKVSLCKIQDYANCNFTKFECHQMYGFPLKSMFFLLPWQRFIRQHFFSQNMQNFMQAHTPTKFEVHTTSTLENHIFKSSLTLMLYFKGPHIFFFFFFADGLITVLLSPSILHSLRAP